MSTLIIPGYLGSGDGHWQTWLESQISSARRVDQEWHSPILVRWAENVRSEIDRSKAPVWLVAHSFGCLAAVTAASDRANKVAGAMLVAPANPERFTLGGIRKPGNTYASENLNAYIPKEKLPFPSLVIASTDDPWMPHENARYWSDLWGGQFISLGKSGHINVESGFGPWPDGIELFKAFQQHHHAKFISAGLIKPSQRNYLVARQGYVSRVRHATRRYFEINA